MDLLLTILFCLVLIGIIAIYTVAKVDKFIRIKEFVLRKEKDQNIRS